MNTTIYIFGNLPVFQAALTGLQMIFNPANNTDWAVGGSLFGVGPIVGIGLLISLLHVTTKGVWTQKMSLHHVGIMLGLYAAMFIPTTSVQVQDIYTGQTVIVDKIPIGVAYPAAIVSQLSYDAATQLGQAFQMATATAPTTNISQGFAEPLQQMLQMRRLYQNYVKTAPQLADAEFSFFQQCVYPVYSSDTTLQAAYNETNNILATVTNTNYVTASGANMMVNVLGGTGNPICGSSQGCLLTCNGLASTLNTQYTQWKGSSGSGSCTAAVALAGAEKAETLKPPSSCTTAASDLGNVLAQLGTTGDQYIDQMVHGCMASAGMSAGGSLFAGTPSMSVLPSYCLITQNSLSQAQVENAGAASMFLKNMLPLMSVLQFLFIAMAPLAAFTMVMAGAQGMGMFVKYIMFGLWTQSWLPVAAMLNDYSQITLAHTLGVLGQAVTGVSANITTAATSVTLASMPPPPSNGLTLTTIPTVIESTMQALSNADMLLALTPLITMVVFTGSYISMANLANSLGGEDKVGKNAELETPSIKRQETDYDVQASGSPGARDVVNPLGNAVSLDVGSTVSAGASAARTQEASATRSLNDSIGQTASSTVSMLRSHKDIEAAERAAAATGNTKLASELAAMNKSGQTFSAADEQKLGTELAAVIGLSGGVSGAFSVGKKGEGLSGGAKVSLDGSLQGKTGGSVGQTAKQAALHELAETLASKQGSDFVKQLADSHKEGNSSETSGSLQSSLQQMHQRTAALQKAVKNADSWSQTAQEAQTWGGGATLHSKDVQNALISQGLGGGKAMPYLQQMADQGGEQAGAQFKSIYDRYMSTGSWSSADAASVAILTVARGNATVAAQLLERTLGQGGAVSRTQNTANQRFGAAKQSVKKTSSEVDAGQQALAPDGAAADKAGRQADTTGRRMATSGVTQYGPTPSLNETPGDLARQGRQSLGSKYKRDTKGTNDWIGGKTGEINSNIAVQGANEGQKLEQGASDGIRHVVKAVEQNIAGARQTGAAYVASRQAEAKQAEQNAANVDKAFDNAVNWQANRTDNPSDGMVRLPNGNIVPAGEAPPQDEPTPSAPTETNNPGG